MSWTPPRLPTRDRESVVAYWRQILEIPDDEVGAPMLREMATERLRTLGAEFPSHPQRPNQRPGSTSVRSCQDGKARVRL